MRKIEGFDRSKLRYLIRNHRTNAEMLRSLVTLHGYNRKSAIRLRNRGVNHALTGCKSQKRGPKARCQDPEFRGPLHKLWGDME